MEFVWLSDIVAGACAVHIVLLAMNRRRCCCCGGVGCYRQLSHRGSTNGL